MQDSPVMLLGNIQSHIFSEGLEKVFYITVITTVRPFGSALSQDRKIKFSCLSDMFVHDF